MVRQIISRLQSAGEMLETANRKVSTAPKQGECAPPKQPTEPTLMELLETANTLAYGVDNDANDLAAKIGH